MDQDTSGGNDKRNWRERLGIGTKDVAASKEAGGKDMPRVAAEFRPARVANETARPAVAPAANVKPAPMAPRAVARPAPAPAPTVNRAPAMQPDALANKLKSQREAAEKMAEQRVIAARQRAEAALAPIAEAPSKPKFAFADDDTKVSRPPLQPSLQPQRTQQPIAAARPSPLPPATQPIAPPRPQLGANVAVPQRAPMPPQPRYPQGQPYNQQQGYSNNYVPTSAQPPQQNYAPPPAYRPIDPATGYAPPPAYQPSQGYAPAPRQQYESTQQGQPRLQIPPRAPQLSPAGYEPTLQAAPRRPMQPNYQEQEQDDIFERPVQQRGQRRATANDYQQAYREVESGYDDENSRSNVPWILVGLLALVLVGFGSIWAYANYVKPAMTANTATTEQNVPVVKAPEEATKVTPTAEPETTAPAAGQAAPPTKKQIYDRIVGDREVLGGEIVPTEETPVQPTSNAQPVPDPVPDAATGTDGTPLPLPPPPGDNTQGALEPSGKADQQIANITPAASESLAADSQIAPPPVPSTAAPEQPAAAAPVPGDVPALKQVETAPETPAVTAKVTSDETIQDTPEKPKVEPKAATPKKLAAAPKAEKSLGFKPVVLVPAVKQSTRRTTPKLETAQVNAGNSIYGDGTIAADEVVTPAPVQLETPAPKRKSLLDLFKRNKETVGQDIADSTVNDTPLDSVGQADIIPSSPTPQKVAVLAKKPSPITTNPTPTGAYVAQLASFKSKAEATQEYARMKAKHGAIISRYAPIISQAQVAGTTRYRLNLGPMASSNVASGFCQSLFAAGERDCLVQRQ